MNEKIEKAITLIERGYSPIYEKQVKTIPAVYTSLLTLKSLSGNTEKIEFTGMEVSAADSMFIKYLKTGE